MNVDELTVGAEVVWLRHERAWDGSRYRGWKPEPQRVPCTVAGLPKREGGSVVVDVPGWGRRHVDAKHLHPRPQEEPCRSRPTK